MKKTDPIAKFQFAYQHIIVHEGIPYFTCVVPTSWLSKNLPKMGGAVFYVDRRDTANRTACIVEFINPVMEGNSLVSISLDMHKWSDEQGGYSSCFEAPVEIHCGSAIHSGLSIEGGVETALLHHLFGHQALSATMNNIYVDMADIIGLLPLSKKYEFALAVGETPAEIMPKLQDGLDLRMEKSGSAFLMLFCNEIKIRLEHLNAFGDVFEGSDSNIIYSDVAVAQDMMLISALIGHYDAAAKSKYIAPPVVDLGEMDVPSFLRK